MMDMYTHARDACRGKFMWVPQNLGPFFGVVVVCLFVLNKFVVSPENSALSLGGHFSGCFLSVDKCSICTPVT